MGKGESMNQSQFVHELMCVLFGSDYEYISDEDCSYELALGMIKEKYGALKTVNEPELFPVTNSILNKRPTLRETQERRQGQL